MNELSMIEIEQVSGGDSWAGTPEGQAPYGDGQSAYVKCVTDGYLGGGGPLTTLVKCAILTLRD